MRRTALVYLTGAALLLEAFLLVAVTGMVISYAEAMANFETDLPATDTGTGILRVLYVVAAGFALAGLYLVGLRLPIRIGTWVVVGATLVNAGLAILGAFIALTELSDMASAVQPALTAAYCGGVAVLTATCWRRLRMAQEPNT
jgi:hypothetical protein